jgi:ABC-type antimicrobial peptide transport system permease subunit
MFTVYEPYWQISLGQLSPSLAIKTTGDPISISPMVRDVIRSLDAELPIPAFRAMGQVIGDSVAERRFQSSLVLLFGVASLLLAAFGVYGVIACAVAQRTNEIGIHMALGANRRSVERRVIAEALKLVGGGLVVGIPVALVVATSLRAVLFGVAPQDPATLVGASAALVVTALLAAAVPAFRASRVDPMVALRHE